MKITKRQLKRIIREEYSRLKRKGLINETTWPEDPDMIDPNDPQFSQGNHRVHSDQARRPADLAAALDFFGGAAAAPGEN